MKNCYAMNQDITQLVWDQMLVNEVNLYFQLIDRKICSHNNLGNRTVILMCLK